MSVKQWAVEGPDGELVLRPDRTVRLWRTREAAADSLKMGKARVFLRARRKVVRVEITRV